MRERPHDPQIRGEFEAWRAADTRHALAYDRIEDVWLSPELTTALGDLAPSRATRWLPVGVVAAVLILSVLVLPEALLRLQSDYVAEIGQSLTAALPDGSTVVLNSGAAIAIDFSDGRRAVSLLRGEAFFAVAHDPDHPFTVSGRYAQATVKGTEFSFQTTSDEDVLVLESGRVDFAGANGTAESVEAGQVASADARSVSAAVPANVESLLAWKDGRLEFVGVPLETVLEEMQRYRRAPVLLVNRAAARLPITASYRLDGLDGALASLAAATGLTKLELPGSVVILL